MALQGTRSVKRKLSKLDLELDRTEYIPREISSTPQLHANSKILSDYLYYPDSRSPNSKFDEECIARYGEQTCILYQIQQDTSSDKYELRTLNNASDPICVSKKLFSELIPSLVSKKYTVVIVDYITGSGHDITAVHTNDIKLFNPIILF
ncbi:hypothetical protein EB118_01995 [bacterium]|nr:hypothetical protein [bacterium]NDC94189.1 hypothetical protein [bacterium]NDD83021.1 hypothetical protein [bacterium]NDG28859.1 hypothetical protein [bacterium]